MKECGECSPAVGLCKPCVEDGLRTLISDLKPHEAQAKEMLGEDLYAWAVANALDLNVGHEALIFAMVCVLAPETRHTKEGEALFQNIASRAAEAGFVQGASP